MPSPGELVRAARVAIVSGFVLLASNYIGQAQPFNSTHGCPGSDLFSPDQVQVLHITISQGDLERLRREPRQMVPAVIEEGTSYYAEVAVHLKGSVGSFRAIDDKPGFTLDFATFRPGQKFHGLRRIHLNNSVEDPSYCNELLGGEVFRTAGIPAPRVSRALVFLNNRRLGLYVLAEGFTEDFLSCYFSHVGGNLFEPGEGHDVNQHLKRVSIPAPAQGRVLLKRLGAATLENDPGKQWTQLQATLDVNRFVRFMALEIMLSHRDGYSLARNNFRLYQDIDSGLMVFLPQGMDQLFGIAELPWKPHMAGLVARSILQTTEGQRQYEEQFRTLFLTVLQSGGLTNRVSQLMAPLKNVLNDSEFATVQAAADALRTRIVQRQSFLATELNDPGARPLQFTNGVAFLGDWNPVDTPSEGQMNHAVGPGGRDSLHIQTRSESFASWRTRARLEPGRYRFIGGAAVSGVKPLPAGTHQGAALRIAGYQRDTSGLLGTSGWTVLKTDFQVNQGWADLEFICELRASAGDVWFECNSLRILKLE